MEKQKPKDRMEHYLDNYQGKTIPQLSVDCCLFCFDEGELQVLLLKFIGQDIWALPGGFILQTEDLDEAALRVLKERTGLENLFLRQFHTFGKAARRYESETKRLFHSMHISMEKAAWVLERYITVGYYALVRKEEVSPRTDLLSDEFAWISIEKLPALIIDHREIILKARQLLKTEILSQPVLAPLLPDQFSIPDLQALYETLLERDRPIDRGNFRKKILKSGMLEPLNEEKKGLGHRAPKLYKFANPGYLQYLQAGIKLGF